MDFWLLIAIGGFIGAVLRYFISGFFQNGVSSFPLGTMAVNLIGSYILGFIMYASEYQGLFSDQTRAFLTVGMLGAFTTMSTFSYESFRLFENGEVTLFALNLAGTVIIALFAVYLGKITVLTLWR